jgi:hypothetical protein
MNQPKEEQRESKNLAPRLEHDGGLRVIDDNDGKEIANVSGDDPVTWEWGSGGGCARVTFTLLVRRSEIETDF